MKMFQDYGDEPEYKGIMHRSEYDDEPEYKGIMHKSGYEPAHVSPDKIIKSLNGDLSGVYKRDLDKSGLNFSEDNYNEALRRLRNED